MIKFNFANIFTNTNGLSKAEFKDALKAYQNTKKIWNQKKELGFLELPFQTKSYLENLKKEGSRIRKNFDNVIFIGIGGSTLGTTALFTSLKPLYNKKPNLYFLDNPESEYLDNLIKKLDFKKTLLIPISKSGNTIETLAIFAVLYQKMQQKIGKAACKNVIVITEKNHGTLNQLAIKEGFKFFEIPKNVGGRFSVFSNVGLLPATIMDIDIEKLLKGAANANKKIAYELAIIQYLLYQKNKTITVLFPYGKKLENIASWYIQLLAESIGKNEKVGPTPIKAVGTIDQHSQLQLFMDGPNNKFLIFLEIEKEKKVAIPKIWQQYKPYKILNGKDLHQLLKVEMRGTVEALKKVNRPNITLTIPEVNEETTGELLMTLELKVAILGELFGVNAFNQPGVELSKIFTEKYLNQN